MLTCRQAIQLIAQAMDRPLRWKEHLSLFFHTTMCRYCSRFQKQMKWIHVICKNEFQALDDDLLSNDKLSHEARVRITKKMSKHLN